MRLRSLEGLARDYDFCVLDTSACDATNAPQDVRKKYFLDLRRIVAAHSGIVAVRGVNKEIGSPDFGAHRIVFRGSMGWAFEALKEYFLKKEKDNGNYREYKEYPRTDTQLAALACALAHGKNNVAFLSSDRKLNELLYDCTSKIESGEYPNRFPIIFRGEIEIYSFIQSKAIFVPYREERRRFPELQEKIQAEAQMN